MNEEALDYGYSLFKADGYDGSLEDYKELIETNKEALDYSYELFKQDGYTDSIDDFTSLIGVKKKDATELPSEDGSLDSAEGDLRDISENLDEVDKAKKTAFNETFMSALSGFNNMLVSIPAGIYDLASFVTTPISKAIGQEAASSEDLKESLGIEKSLSDYYKEEQEKYRGKAREAKSKFMENADASIVQSIKDGNWNDALYATFYSSLESLPVSLAMMAGGAAATMPQLATGATLAFFEPSMDELRELNPEASQAKNTVNAITMAAAESVFSSINAKAITNVYKGIIKKEGLEQGTKVFKKTMVDQLTEAIKKYGVPVAALSEGIEEVATQVTQNAVKGKPLFEGAGDAFIVGAAMGGTMTAPINAKKALESFNDVVEYNVEEKKSSEIINNSKYKDVSEAFVSENVQEIDSDQLDIMSLPKSKDILKRNLDKKLSEGDITKGEAEEILNNYNEVSSINTSIDGLGYSKEQKSKIIDLLKRKKSIQEQIAGKDPSLVKTQSAEISDINSQLESIATGKEEVSEETAPVEDVVAQPAAMKVSEVINRPVVLTKLGGSQLDTPIEGDLYVEGQQLVIEDTEGNITEIGNIDEVSDTSLEEIGITEQVAEVQPTTEGNLSFQGETFVTEGSQIKKNKKGDINRVIVRNSDGSVTKTLRGANAQEAAYQILLKQAQSPEQIDLVNQQLEQDEEFQNELRKTTEPTQEQAAPDTGKAAKQAYVQELEQTKKQDPKTYWTVSEVDQQTAESGTLIDDADGSALVKEDGDIVGVFKKTSSKAKGVAQRLLQKAVEAGGVKLDNFDNYLTPIYKKAGFRVAGRVPFNEEFAPEGWKPEFGKPDVVAMVYDPNNELDIQEQTFDDYDKMIEYRDSFLLDDQTKIDKESDDFLSSVGQRPLFQKEAAPTNESEVEVITEEMNELSDERASFDVPSDLTTKKRTNIKSLVDRFGEKVKRVKDISEFNGTPFIFTISDQLTTGDFVNPVTGNTLKFFGGLGFNMTNDTSAWANVTETASKNTIKTAKEVYSKNKDLFDRLWSEGKLPNGHVPMAVVKMGQNSIESNEAVFRVVSDNVKSKFNLKDRTAAKNNLLRQLKGKKANNRVIDFVSKYKTIDEVLDNITEIPLGLRSEVGSFVFYGSPTLGAPTKPGTPNSPVLKSLLDGKDNSLRALFHLPTINNQIREESTKNIPDGHVISIVGVDVVNSKVTSTEDGDFQHQNYEYGVKGQLIGVLENPVHAADVFPEMYSKSVYTFKENKKGKLPTPKVAVSQSVAASGAIAVTKAFRGAKVSTKMSTLDVLLGKLRQAFPNVTVVNTQAEFDAVVNSPEVSKYSRDGDIIYGFTKDGKVFLNPKIANTNTAIHEYGHVWMNFVEKTNPNLLTKGYKLLEGTEILKEKIKIHGNNKTARMEALADLIGNKGESIANAGQKSKFKNWLNAMYTYVKSKFKAFSEMSADDFQDLTLDQFVDGVLSDLLSGREVTDKVVKSIETTFQKINSKDLIEKGIEGGFSKDAIKLGLEKLNTDTSDFDNQYKSLKDKYDLNVSKPVDTNVGRLREKSEKAIQDRRKKKSFKQATRIVREKLLDSQTRIKDLLKSIGSKEAGRAADLLVTKAGADGYANYRFKKADKEIYEGLNTEDNNRLDELIYARRIAAINENRRIQGKEKYTGVDGYNEQNALQDIASLENSLGKEKFADLSKRADVYFKEFNDSLLRMKDAGIINEQVYNQLKDTEYSPIKTIKYLIPESYDASEVSRMSRISGISSDAIKTLSDENVNDVVMDSRHLLMANLSMIESRIFENRLLNEFNKAIEGANAQEKEALKDYIKDNPVVSRKKDGEPVYKYQKETIPKGFRRVNFIEDGNKRFMVIQDTYANQLLDVKKDQGKLEKGLKNLTGVNILRFFATSGNPLFIIGNTAVDFQNILFLSDVYSNNKFKGAANLAADFVKTFVSKVRQTEGYKAVYDEFMLHGGSMEYLSVDGIKALENSKLLEKPGVKKARKAVEAYAGFLSYLGETSEVSFRVAVYEKSKSNKVAEFKKINKREPNQQEMEDIMFSAAREARETIDFSQGGETVKAADQWLPYLNAATQGTRKMIDYASTNPQGFAVSMAQYGLMSASVAAASIFTLLRSLDDEDDVLEVLNSVSEYEKANYHIIFTGERDDEGQFTYHRIKKLPVIGSVSAIAENMVYAAALKTKGVDYGVDSENITKSLLNILPVDVDQKNPLLGLVERNPLLAATTTYSYNYDSFYDQPVFKGPRGKSIDPTAEGIYDSRVDQIYKDIAPMFGLSPKRSKAFMEKIFTSENTNPLIGLVYSGYDAAFKNDTSVGEEILKTGERLTNTVSKKVTRKTNKNLLRYKREAEAETQKTIIQTKKYKAEQKVYSEITKRYKDEKGTFTNEEYVALIKENFEPKDHRRYADKYIAYIKNMNADRTILDIIYEQDNDVQALMLFNRFGTSLDKQEEKEIIKVYRSAGRRISKKAIAIYRQKYVK